MAPASPASQAVLAGRYRYRGELGRGAMGRVIRAEDGGAEPPGSPCALKVVDGADGGRLLWEFQALSRVAHPNVARVMELIRVVEAMPAPFRLAAGAIVLVEDLIDGKSADQWLAAIESLEDRLLSSLRVMYEVALGLSAIHQEGLVHGDIKPANIVVDGKRSVLVDLGLAARPQTNLPIGGTPGYLAPEVFLGDRSIQSDLYAFGVTLYELSQGQPAFGDPGSQSIASTMASAMALRAASLPFSRDTPPSLQRLILCLLADHPDERLHSARETAARIAAIASDCRSPWAKEATVDLAVSEQSPHERRLRVAHLPHVGFKAERDQLAAALEHASIVRVGGPPESGKTRLVHEAVRIHQQQVAALGDTAIRTFVRSTGTLPRELLASSIVHVGDAERISMSDARRFCEAQELRGYPVVLILEGADGSQSMTDTIASVELGPLARPELARLLSLVLQTPTVSESQIDGAIAASGGLAGRLCRLAAVAIAQGRDITRATTLRGLGSEATGAFIHRDLSQDARDLMECLAVVGGSLPIGTIAANQRSAIPELLTRAFIQQVGGEITVRHDVVRALRAELSPATGTKWATAFDLKSLPPTARAFALVALGRGEEALRELHSAVVALRAKGDPEEAVRLMLEFRRSIGGSRDLDLDLVDALRACGRYEEALAFLEGYDDAAARCVRAELHRRLGATDAAISVLGDNALSDDAQAVRVRVAFDAGQPIYDEALRLLETGASARVRAIGAEVVALSCLHENDLSGAEQAVERGLGATRSEVEPAAAARLWAVAGQISLRAGRPHQAVSRFAQACDRAEAAGEVHAEGTYLVNLGLARIDCGDLGPGLASLRAGAAMLSRIGRRRDLSYVLYNMAHAAALLGDYDLAASMTQRVHDHAAEDSSVCSLAWTVAAETQLDASQVDAARAFLEDALRCSETSSRFARGHVLVRAASMLAALGDVQRGEELLALLDLDTADIVLRLEGLVAKTRLALGCGQTEVALRVAEEAQALAVHQGTFESRLRSALALADAAQASGDTARGRQALAQVRSMLDQASRGLTASARARLRGVPAYRRAFVVAPVSKQLAAGDPRLSSLLAWTARLLSETRLPRLREKILEAALSLSGAERGFLIERAANETRVVAALEESGGFASAGSARFSHSVLDQAFHEGRVVSTVDASVDERLSHARSVHALSLRSVLCAPLGGRRDLAIYLEDRLRPAAFDEIDIELMSHLADLAARALSVAESLWEERQAVRRLTEEREDLSRTVERQALQLASFWEARIAPLGIIAKSETMKQAVDLALRAAASKTPVLIRGESGTGKELIARLIHDNGSTAGGPFVSHSCAAIPETLLMTSLFGHEQGAFTGAYRSQVGVFEAADDGTLFLDEIAETSTAAQAALLRVVQEGRFRAVGGTEERSTRARLIAATHRDPRSMMEAQTFRPDLYYRLAVIEIYLPPLRDRLEDIDALVAALLLRHVPDRDVHVSREVRDAFRCYEWPGNVRELDNELQRALILADHDEIALEHLSPRIREGHEAALSELDLRGHVERVERRLIRQALERCGGNQTQAAKQLGVSRFGLQKMIKRLGACL